MGTLNSFQVSHSWLVGGIVLVVDVLKGAGAALLGVGLANGNLLFAAVGGLGAIVGHNYPVWLAFRGGRGLATASGAALVVFWVIVPVWFILWAAAYLLLRSVNPANALASGVLLVLAGVTPSGVFEHLEMGPDSGTIRWFVIAMMIVILLRHVGPVKEFLAKNTQNHTDFR